MKLIKVCLALVFLLVFSADNAEGGIILLLLLKLMALKGGLFLGMPLAIGSFMMGQGMGFFGGSMFGGYAGMRTALRYTNRFNKPKVKPTIVHHYVPAPQYHHHQEGWGWGWDNRGWRSQGSHSQQYPKVVQYGSQQVSSPSPQYHGGQQQYGPPSSQQYGPPNQQQYGGHQGASWGGYAPNPVAQGSAQQPSLLAAVRNRIVGTLFGGGPPSGGSRYPPGPKTQLDQQQQQLKQQYSDPDWWKASQSHGQNPMNTYYDSPSVGLGQELSGAVNENTQQQQYQHQQQQQNYPQHKGAQKYQNYQSQNNNLVEAERTKELMNYLKAQEALGIAAAPTPESYSYAGAPETVALNAQQSQSHLQAPVESYLNQPEPVDNSLYTQPAEQGILTEQNYPTRVEHHLHSLYAQPQPQQVILAQPPALYQNPSQEHQQDPGTPLYQNPSQEHQQEPGTPQYSIFQVDQSPQQHNLGMYSYLTEPAAAAPQGLSDYGQLNDPNSQGSEEAGRAVRAPNSVIQNYLEKKLKEEMAQATSEQKKEAEELITMLRQAYMDELVESLNGPASTATPTKKSRNIFHQSTTELPDFVPFPSDYVPSSTTSRPKRLKLITLPSGEKRFVGVGVDGKRKLFRVRSKVAKATGNASSKGNSTVAVSLNGTAVQQDVVSKSVDEPTKFEPLDSTVVINKRFGEPAPLSASASPRNRRQTSADLQALTTFADDIKKFFLLVSVLDQDKCLQKLVCEVHTRTTDEEKAKLTPYETNILMTFKVMNVLLPADSEDSTTHYRAAAKIGELGKSADICSKAYPTCNFSSAEIISMGNQVAETTEPIVSTLPSSGTSTARPATVTTTLTPLEDLMEDEAEYEEMEESESRFVPNYALPTAMPRV